MKVGQEVCALLLMQHSAKLRMDFIANALCEAASDGDLHLLRLLVATGAHVDSCDYDARTALHLAAVEGQLLTVDYLVNTCHADVNIADRWHSTAFQDAIKFGHMDVAVLIHASGGELGQSSKLGAEEFIAVCGDKKRVREVHRKVARLADRFHGRGWKLRGSTQAVRRNDEGDNMFIGKVAIGLIGYITTLQQSYSELYRLLHGLLGDQDFIEDDVQTSTKPTCSLVRVGDPAMIDHAIIGMQRLLAQRYASKGQKADEKSRRKKKKKKKESSDANSDDGEGDADGEEEEEEEEEAKKQLGGDNQPAKKTMRERAKRESREKREHGNKLRREWSDEGEKAKAFSRILLKFGSKVGWCNSKPVPATVQATFPATVPATVQATVPATVPATVLLI